MPAGSASVERLALNQRMPAALNISGPVPDSIRVSYLSDMGYPSGMPQDLPYGAEAFAVTADPGLYILVVQVAWPEANATYYFQVAISD